MRQISTFSVCFVLALLAASTINAQKSFFEIKSGEHEAEGPVNVETRASNTIDLSYISANATMWSDCGLSVNGNWRIGVAVVFPKEMVEQYVGAKVTHVSFGWNTEKYSPKADWFVRTELNGEDKATASKVLSATKVSSSWQGSWVKAKMDNEYVIEPDKDLVIGLYLDMQPVGAAESCIATCTNGGAKPGINFMMNCSLSEEEGGQEWIDIYDAKTPYPIFASATLVDEGGNMQNLCLIDGYYVAPIMQKDTQTGGWLRVKNTGTNNISNFKLQYNLGDTKRTYLVTPSKEITPGSTSVMIVPYYALGSGEHTMQIATVNGKENSQAEPKPYTAIGVPADVASEYKMTALVEYFSGENSHYSVRNYEDYLVPGLAAHGDDLVVVNQHMDDQFMCFDFDANNEYDDATTMLIDFCDGDKSKVMAPVMCANRTAYNDPSSSTGTIPSNPAVLVYSPMFVDSYLYEPALNTPTFASVKAEYKLKDDNKKMDIHVSGDIAENILPEGEKLYLTVYVMEDDVMTTSQEFPDDASLTDRWPDGVYYQQNIIRLCLTPMYGIEIGDRGVFEKDYEVELEEEWKIKDMSVVAFLSRSSKNDKFNRNVINTTETCVSKEDAVDGVAGTTARREVYNVNGQRVNRVAKGLYITSDKKVVVR